jgi:hypothetical protein
MVFNDNLQQPYPYFDFDEWFILVYPHQLRFFSKIPGNQVLTISTIKKYWLLCTGARRYVINLLPF